MHTPKYDDDFENDSKKYEIDTSGLDPKVAREIELFALFNSDESPAIDFLLALHRALHANNIENAREILSDFVSRDQKYFVKLVLTDNHLPQTRQRIRILY
jgi:hypothetical protein